MSAICILLVLLPLSKNIMAICTAFHNTFENTPLDLTIQVTCAFVLSTYAFGTVTDAVKNLVYSFACVSSGYTY